MGNSILYNTAGSIALAINYEMQGPYNDHFLTKEGDTTLRINAEFYCRVDDTVFCIESDVDLTESDLDTGSSFDASDTYYAYACQPLDGSKTPVFKLSKNSTYPSGGWDADNSRKIGGFDTDGDGYIDDATLWDLRTVDVTTTGVEDNDIPANEISLSKLVNGTAGAFLRRNSSGVTVEDAKVALQNLLTNSGFGVWSNSNGPHNYGDAIAEDDCADDDTGDWSISPADCSLAFDTDHYEFTTSAIQKAAYINDSGYTAGHLYKISFDVKDGTASGVSCRLEMSASSYSAGFTTTASFVTHTFTFEATSTTHNTMLRVMDDLSGNNIEFKNFSVYEVRPGCTAANTSGPDGWVKDTTVYAYREPNGSKTKDGAYYSLHISPTTENDYLYWPSSVTDQEHLARFAGKTISFGAWVKTSVASHARLGIYDSVTGYTYSNYHTGGGDWEWLEVTATIDASSINTQVLFQCVTSSGSVYISQPILIFGASIGEGNYSRPPGEIIWFESVVNSQLLDNQNGKSDEGAGAINPRSDSGGVIPKNAQAVFVFTNIRDSGSSGTACKLMLGADLSDTRYPYYHRLHGLANDSYSAKSGFVNLNENGDYEYQVDATGVGTFDIANYEYLGVILK